MRGPEEFGSFAFVWTERRSLRNARAELFAQCGDMLRKFVRTHRSFAAPEGHGGGGALRVFHQHAAGLHAANAPGGIAEKNDVAGEAFDGEIFVDRADGEALGLGHYGVEGIFRNRAAAGDGSQTRTATCA